MLVADTLKQKGSVIHSMLSTETVGRSVQLLAGNQIGALVVFDADNMLEGILSERDVVNAIARHGATALELQVGIFMCREVVSCAPYDSITQVARTMTWRRIRHLPVFDRNDLVGLISIGDVLKHRLDEVELETRVLRDVAISLR